MKHFHDLTVLTTHTKASMLTYKFNIDKGLITWAGCFFAPGCHGLIHSKIFFQAHQIMPRNQEGWMHGNGGWWDGELYFPVTAEPMEIRIEAWADSTNYDHIITIGIELMPWGQVPAWKRQIALMEEWLKFIGAPLPEIPVTEFTP